MTKMVHNYTAATTVDATADYLLIDPASTGIYKSINRNTLLALASAPLGTTDSQSPQNKTLDNTNSITVKDGSLTIQNTASTTKQAVFSASGITAGQTRTFTFPDASGTLVTTGATQTLTAKTLTSPIITGGTYDNGTITVDSISGHTVATTVTVANLQIANGVLNTANAVTATSIAAGAIQPQALVSGTGSGWAWSTWAPVFTNWTIGTGGAAGTTAKYIQIGKAVFFRLASVLGTTGQSVGSGVSFTLPSTPVSMGGSGTSSMWIGRAWFEHTGVSSSQGFAKTSSVTGSSTCFLTVINVSGTYSSDTSISSTVPFTWAAGDSINIEGFYETT